ncbi:MAG: allantoicase [SAR324 cluster bacterium]|nr:allantoicase [SAR324 cluster bacterium]
MATENDNDHYDLFSSKWVSLADEALGAQVLSATDEFFGEKENLIKPGRGIFIPNKYTDQGKWIDGWETRRKRGPGYDSCVIRLGVPGTIRGVDIDTNHFKGNHPPFASLEACCIQDDPTEKTEWQEILRKTPTRQGCQNLIEVHNNNHWTHVRLNIHPDGGVARLRVYGDVFVDWSKLDANEIIDLAAVQNGGKVLACNNMRFSSKDNLIQPGRGKNMDDGWETRRRRTPGHDWAILKLGRKGSIKKVEVDTKHFKGNYPESCSLEGAVINPHESDVTAGGIVWKTLLSRHKLKADHQHFFELALQDIGPVSHVRLNIFPDGGISRLRLFGVIETVKLIELNDVPQIEG